MSDTVFLWHNFRDLNAAVTRMATLAAGGRMTVDAVEQEMARLRASWSVPNHTDSGAALESILTESQLAEIDPFDHAQLAAVVTVCRGSRTLSDAGRKLFAVSRAKKGTPNDADRLRKYLARFGLDWGLVQG